MSFEKHVGTKKKKNHRPPFRLILNSIAQYWFVNSHRIRNEVTNNKKNFAYKKKEINAITRVQMFMHLT